MRDKIAEIIIHAWDTGYLKDAMEMLKEEMVHACGEPIGKDHIMKGGIE